MAFITSTPVLRVPTPFARSGCGIATTTRSPSRPSTSRALVVRAEAGDKNPLSDDLLRDAQRLRSKKGPQSDDTAQQQQGGFKAVVEKVLIVDFFIICVVLGWLAVAVVAHYGAHDDTLLDSWLAQWPLIQGLLGVLMLAALTQGLTSYLSDRMQ